MIKEESIRIPVISQQLLNDDGIYPNSKLPVLIYQHALNIPLRAYYETVKEIFAVNGWANSWAGGIYSYHHYHSNTHEVLGICKGNCVLITGGPGGAVFTLSKGDVIIIPAGVAHKNLKTSEDFMCVGAYPDGVFFDVRTGKKSERPMVDNTINKLTLPAKDPVYGKEGPLFDYWQNKATKTITVLVPKLNYHT